MPSLLPQAFIDALPVFLYRNVVVGGDDGGGKDPFDGERWRASCGRLGKEEAGDEEEKEAEDPIAFLKKN